MGNTSPELNFEPSDMDLTILDVIGVAPTYIEMGAPSATHIFTTVQKGGDREEDY